jgi:MFS family permease
MNARRIALLAAIFTLCATEFLQSGMIAFSSAPIMGEIGAAPEEFSMIAALYACVAVITIAKQQWLMERVGWRVYLGGSCLVFVAGAMMCAHGDRIFPFAIGRVIMALGGGALMATARLLVNVQAPGPSRFLGIKVFASGLGSGMALAPLLASWAIVTADRSLIFYILSAAMVLGTLLAMSSVPHYVRPEQYSSQSGTMRLLFLAASSFFLLYLLQRTYYDFYSDALILTCFLVLALFGLYAYFHIEHAHPAPLLNVRQVLSRRYVIGMSIFCTGYILLGANNYAIPIFMQRGLGYSWETTGELQAFGLASSVVTWLIMSSILPRSPGLRKYLATGLTCLVLFSWQMHRLSPAADLYTTVLPALMLYGSFIILTLATAAMQTFRDMLRSDGLFVHGYQIKAMMAQIAVAIGTTVSTILIQWRSTVQYDHLTVHIHQGSSLFRDNVVRLAGLLGQHGDATMSARQATALIAGEVAQQATLLAGLEFFTVVCGVGIVALLVLAGYHFLSGSDKPKNP